MRDWAALGGYFGLPFELTFAYFGLQVGILGAKNDLKKVIEKRSGKVMREFSCGDCEALKGDSKKTTRPHIPDPCPPGP